jgi:serine/threonine protein kinase
VRDSLSALIDHDHLLQPETLPSYLIERHLLSPRLVVQSDLKITDYSSRNRNFLVTSRRGPNFFLKQGVRVDAISTLSREALFYQRLGSRSGGLSQFLPGFVCYDQDRAVLILEAPRDVETLASYHARENRFGRSLGVPIGTALGRLHRVDSPTELGSGGNASLRAPWIQSIRPDRLPTYDVSPANDQILKIVHGNAELISQFQSLFEEPITTTLVHNDLKSANLLISRRSTRARIVDWELAGIGDPCWDVGSVFADVVSWWLATAPISGKTDPSHVPGLARYPLTRNGAFLRSFWEAYVRARVISAELATQTLVRSVRCAAARLVQTAFESSQFQIKITACSVCLLQLSANIFRRPHEASIQLLGLSLPVRGGD